MRKATLLALVSVLLITPTVAAAENYRKIAVPINSGRSARVTQSIQKRIMARQVVRRPSCVVRNRLYSSQDNQRNLVLGKSSLKNLAMQIRGGGVKRALRRGYGSRDVEYRASGLAKKLSLKPGQTIEWNTRGAHHSLKASSHSKVVLTSRVHDTYMTALRGAVNRVTSKIAANSKIQLTSREMKVLALAPTDMRAEALARHGVKLERVKSGGEKNLKYKIYVKPDKLELYNKVFGPNVSTYLPGKGHSMYVHKGLVWETFHYKGSSTLRPSNKSIYPVMLTNQESLRMDQLMTAITNGTTNRGKSVQGALMPEGRPALWPMKLGDTATGNTCTTTHHRAPIGGRDKDMKWLDTLNTSISQLARSGGLGTAPAPRKGLAGLLQKVRNMFFNKPNPLLKKQLLTVLTDASPKKRLELLDSLASKPNVSAEDRASIARLRPWVEQYSKHLPAFPLDLLGRSQLKDKMGVPYVKKYKGTTDPVGPGFARAMYSGAPDRIPVLVKLEKE